MGLLNLSFLFTLSTMVLTVKAHPQALTVTPDTIAPGDSCPQKDILDLFTKKQSFTATIPSRKVNAIIIPLVGISPGTGFQIGAGSSISGRLGPFSETKLSAGVASLMVTVKKQLIFQLKTNMFLNRNRWFVQTDWRVYIYRMPTWGLGTGPSGEIPPIPGDPIATSDEMPANGEYPMRFNWIKFHNVISRSITGYFFAGIGYHLDYHFNIHDLTLDTASASYTSTPHYAYCRLHGFDDTKYVASGLSINLVYDTRDNLINAYKGIYLNVNYRYNSTLLGSAQDGSQLWTEFRTYVGLSKKIPRHVLAFWVFGSFLVSGEVPYLDLMACGFDQMNSSGRGYAQGRWRGENFMYGEMEYRFPISRCTGIIGGVLFANVLTASNRDMQVPLFGYFKPGAGFGLRIMVGKQDRTNLLIDFGIGQQSKGLYLQAQEIF